jgi:pimeloyl-ACP methyl ester carboxylesterase
VPSKPDGTGTAAAIAFAGNGYALIAPDYPGLGQSAGMHPYYVADEIGPAITAMIKAAESVKGVPSKPVVLSGFSEGGWASLAALRLLEAEGKPVFGAALVAGAYDLRGTSLPAALTGEAPQHSLYVAYLARAYADRYGKPLDSVLTPEYAVTVERVFDRGSPQEIVAALPSNPRLLFQPEFLGAFDNQGSHWFLDAIGANSLTDVTPKAPIRLYYGQNDRDVLPAEAISAAKAMAARGADAKAIDVGPVGHDQSMLAAAPLILTWIEALERQN